MAGFDIDGLRAEQATTEGREEHAVQHAHDLLTDFVATAGKLGVEPRSVDPGSPAAYATGIALAKWPRSAGGNLTYFPLVTNSGYGEITWLGGESQGLSVTPDSEFFFGGKPTSSTDAAAWLARVCGFDEETITSCLTNALKGSPSSFG